MQEYRNFFNQYFKRFDIRDKAICRKFHHSYRVTEYAKEIGKSLKLNEHDIELCEFIGLFHDLGRFEQWTNYKTYDDSKSIDHGDLSCKILKKENVLKKIPSKDKEIIMTAIKYHNKYDIKDIKDERTSLFCKIIRDADKLDIMIEQANVLTDINQELTRELLDDIYHKRSCHNIYKKSEVDVILVQLGFIFDINFKYSIDFLCKKNWFENKFNLLENYLEDKSGLKELEEFVNKYVKEMILC